MAFAGQQRGYGNIVIVDHGNGTETRYAHQDTIAVSVGQRVGTVGSTGAVNRPAPALRGSTQRRGGRSRGFLS